MDLFGWLESPPQRVIMDTNMGSLGACTPYDFQLFDECSELGFTEDFQGRECPLGEGRIHEVFHEMLRADPRWNKFFGDNAPKFALEQSVFSAQQTKPGLCHRKPKDTQDEAWEVEDSARQTGLVGAFEQFCDIFVDAWLLLGGRKGLQEAIFKVRGRTGDCRFGDHQSLGVSVVAMLSWKGELVVNPSRSILCSCSNALGLFSEYYPYSCLLYELRRGRIS